jgi:hypothetical protein
MADYYSSPEAEGNAQAYATGTTSLTPAKRLAGLTNVAGALVSLALVAGIGVWGYKLLVRDVSGIPVVRAAEGDMRVRPDDPGGQLARHQGLSVNAVAAEGTASAPADELRLAPQPVDLTEEDAPQVLTMVASAPQAEEVQVSAETPVATTPEAPQETPDVAAALQSGNVDDLVAQLTNGVAPLAQAAEAEAAEVVATLSEAVAAEVQAARDQVEAEVVKVAFSGPGPNQSLRPRKRPIQAAEAVQASVDTSATLTPEIDAASLPTGTRLAQLGAFDSEEVAREQWAQLNTRFSAYLSDKQRVIQKASSGGRTFYRLRAMGFEDIADARRFCSALVAENADCIPVVTR